MKNLLKRFPFGRRKIPWILTCLLLILLCSIIVFMFIRHEETTVVAEIESIEPETPRVIAPVVDRNPDQYYLAAVIDYEVLYLPDVRLAVKINLQYIIDAVAECGRLMVDIVVFPEDSLLFIPIAITRTAAYLISTYVPSADDFIVPCHHKEYEQSYLRQISCAAKQSRIYVAVNVMEKVRSGKSTYWDGLVFYKTEVVFDRNGMVVARYRKFNLYTEQWTHHNSAPDEPEYATFTTDFGVEFGIIICFDIFHTKPGVELAQHRNITHFIHSSVLISKLPFLAASAAEFGWSYALDVVVLSSSAPNPKYTLGTNIFFGRRPGTRTYVQPFRFSNIIISPVPKHRHLITPEYPDHFHQLYAYVPGKIRQTGFLVEHVLDQMTSRALTSAANQTSATFSYKSDTFECNVTATWELFGFVPSSYHFIAYSGLNNHSVASINSYAEMCGVTLCSRYSTTFCQQPPVFDDASKTVFNSVRISARSKILDSVRIPAAFDSNLVPLNVTDFDFRSRSEDHSGRPTNRVEMKLKRRSVNLMTFAVYKYLTRSTPISNFNLIDHLKNLKVIL